MTCLLGDKGSRQSSEADSPLASTDHEDGFFKKEDEESDVSLLKGMGMIKLMNAIRRLHAVLCVELFIIIY